MLLILHAVNVPHEAELVISSPDMDVLLLLVDRYAHWPFSTVFLTVKDRLKRNISVNNLYNNLGQKRAAALLGLHALTLLAEPKTGASRHSYLVMIRSRMH